MKNFIITSLIALVLSSEVYAYDQVAKASSPGEWLEDVIDLRLLARCNVECPPGKSWYEVGFKVPDGWQMKLKNGGGKATTTPLNFTPGREFGSGFEFQLKVEANKNTHENTLEPGTFATNPRVSLRRVGNTPGSFIQARRLQGSSDIIWIRLRSISDGWDVITPNLSFATINAVDVTKLMGASVPSLIEIRYNSKIDLSPGETKNMFEVSEAYGSYTVSVNLNGDASSDLTLVHSSGATGNYVCNGSLQKGNVCKIKANSQINWYGQKQAIANITLSII